MSKSVFAICLKCGGYLIHHYIKTRDTAFSSYFKTVNLWECESCGKYYELVEKVLDIEDAPTSSSDLPRYKKGSNRSTVVSKKITDKTPMEEGNA